MFKNYKSYFFASLFLVLSIGLKAQIKGTEQNPYQLEVSPSTIIWGNYWSENKPALTVKSGDFVKVHTLITSNPERLEAAGVAPDLVEKELREVQTVKDRGPGGHILTGPIYVENAEPGDVLEIKIWNGQWLKPKLISLLWVVIEI